jgi:formate hydrogenlyase subunit 3/multisubunit Na+/H+ antiporter MnhD subunit
MDDREEGTRRHLEEVNPAFETFGAAGFFGLPMLWQGLDDEAPTALCPIVVRPENALREEIPSGAEAAYRLHQRRRRLRLTWHERLHQGSRRGCLQAAAVTAAAAPIALLTLLARTIAPGRLGQLLGRSRDTFEKPLPGALQPTAEAAEASRVASADAPRLGFSEDEQVARVGGFLRSIGLTGHFAPLVVIIGHGSDSRNNPHLAAYDCGACSGRHGGPNARVFAALANRPALRLRLAAQGLVIPETTYFLSAEHNTCDESLVWYDSEQLPASHHAAFAALRRNCEEAARLHAVERCRRFASAPARPSLQQAGEHLANRRHDIAQVRPELGHATVAAAFVGRRTMSRGAFFDRRVFLISYDPLPDTDGRVLEATLLAAGPVGAGINLEYYFSTVNNEGYGCGSKATHNLAGLFGVMQGASSDLRTGLPLQMVEIHEPMRLLVIVEQTLEIVNAIYQRQPALQELIGNGWIVLAAKHPQTGAIHLFAPATGWQDWQDSRDAPNGQPMPALSEVDRSADWFAGQRELLPPALLRRPVTRPMSDLDALFAALAASARVLWLVPLLPLLAAALIAVRLLLRRGSGDAGEPITAGIASAAALGALLLLLVLDLAALGGALPERVAFAEWLRIGAVPVRLSFMLDAYSLPSATLVALIAWIALRFSATYLHREIGFQRFFLGMCLFLAGMLLIVLAGNAVLTFIGWELAGISSWLLIGYTWERPVATGNALFVFLTNRVGDAGFMLGIALAVWSVGTLEWAWLPGDGSLGKVSARLLAAGFVLAAMVKSAQLPFTPWIARALEGPTPSSAVFYGSLMVHAGVYLLCRLQGLLLQVPDLLALLAVVGLATAVYGSLCALVQSDVKSALVFSTVTQVGLMFFCCGLGLFWLAAGYSGLHAAWRAYQFLLAPAYMHLVRRPARPVPRWLATQRWWYTAALQRFWIEPLASSLLTRPTLALGRDVRALDERFIDPLVGAPRADEYPALGDPGDELIRGHGLAGRLLFNGANRLQRLENRLLLSGDGALGKHLQRAAQYADAIESLLEQPRYLMLMVMATFVVIL